MDWISSHLEQRQQAAEDLARTLPAALLMDDTDAAVERAIAPARVVPLQLDFSAITRGELLERRGRRTATVGSSRTGNVEDLDLGSSSLGFAVDFAVPFSGDSFLAVASPTRRFMTAAPARVVSGNAVSFRYEANTLEADQMRKFLARTQRQLEQLQTWANEQVADWWALMVAMVRELVMRRRERLLAASDAVEALGVPTMRERAAAIRLAVVEAPEVDPAEATLRAEYVANQVANAALTDDQLRGRLIDIGQSTDGDYSALLDRLNEYEG